jgi:hypothetical protein
MRDETGGMGHVCFLFRVWEAELIFVIIKEDREIQGYKPLRGISVKSRTRVELVGTL